MVLLSVLTTPQRPQYLVATLVELNAAPGAPERRKIVFSDGLWPAPVRLVCGWNVIDFPAVGARLAMWHVFTQAVMRDFETLYYCEDDIVVASGPFWETLRIPVPSDQALVTYFDRTEFPGARGRMKPGFYEVPIMGRTGRGLGGALCLQIPRRTLDYLIERGPRNDDPEEADKALSWALRDSPWKVRGVHLPSLVDHAGDVSGLGGAPGRRASWFAGSEPRG